MVEFASHRLPYCADPERRMPQDMNTKDGGRGLYWLDPDGHARETLNRALRWLAAAGRLIRSRGDETHFAW